MTKNIYTHILCGFFFVATNKKFSQDQLAFWLTDFVMFKILKEIETSEICIPKNYNNVILQLVLFKLKEHNTF